MLSVVSFVRCAARPKNQVPNVGVCGDGEARVAPPPTCGAGQEVRESMARVFVQPVEPSPFSNIIFHMTFYDIFFFPISIW